jgi:hypothetical protein
MYPFKKPDLNAPRFRPESHQVVNTELYKQFIAANPKYNGLDFKSFKEIIYAINGKIWETVIAEREGVELPEQLGYLFIGSCSRKAGTNADHKKSIEYGQLIQNRNWESDEYVAKIFYTNCETKYRFKNHELWGFTGVRQFKRAIAQEYPISFKRYIVVDNTTRVSRLFRKEKSKEFYEKKLLDHLARYDEFRL